MSNQLTSRVVFDLVLDNDVFEVDSASDMDHIMKSIIETCKSTLGIGISVTKVTYTRCDDYPIRYKEEIPDHDIDEVVNEAGFIE